VSSWLRKQFDGVGLTQSPPGPYFAALQAKYGGTVLLCIDVSHSMNGEPLSQAIAGGERFLTEAVGAHYKCGLVLWHHRIARYIPPDAPHDEVLDGLRSPVRPGGTNLVPALDLGKKVLGPRSGDRVMCVFGDGDLGDRHSALGLAQELCAMGIRIVVRGLGPGAMEALSELACSGQRDDEQLIEDVSDIGTGIASMATSLTARRRRGNDER
jgi:Mg-chelatase subunit ChlD